MSSEKKINTPVPPQRQFPQEKPDSEKNQGIHQQRDPEKKEGGERKKRKRIVK